MKVPVRQLVLVGLLRRQRRPVSRSDLIASMRRIGAYGAGNEEAARKMFNRDLRQLRDDGVVIRWVSAHHGYELAESARSTTVMDLTPEDASLLVECARRLTESFPGLGARVEAALEQHEAQALASEGALAVHQPADNGADGDLLLRLVDAAWRRQRVQFAYTTLDGRTGQRRVNVWGVFHRARTWHLVGFDLGREDARTFRLVAMRDLVVEPRAGAFPPPDDPRADVTSWARLQPWHWKVHAPEEAVLACDGVAPLVARVVGGEVDGERVRVTTTNAMALLDVVWRWAPRVVPEAPARLGSMVQQMARGITARHGEGT